MLPATIVTLFVVAIQLEIFSSLRFAGTVIMLVWLWPVAMGLGGLHRTRGVRRVTGWRARRHARDDARSVSPRSWACSLAYGASLLGREGVGDLDSAAYWVTPVLAALAGFAAPLLYTVGGVFVFNFELWRGSSLDMMVVNAVAFFLLARLVTRLARAVASVGERVRR